MPPIQDDIRTVWTYSCNIDTTTGILYYSINNFSLPYVDGGNDWMTPASELQVASEIGEYEEDDMAGTLDNPCIVSDISLKTVNNESLLPITIDPT